MMDILERVSIQHSGIATIESHARYRITVIRPKSRDQRVAAASHLTQNVFQHIAIIHHLTTNRINIRSIHQLNDLIGLYRRYSEIVAVVRRDHMAYF